MRIRRGKQKEPEGSHTRESPPAEVVEQRDGTAFARAKFSGLEWSTTAAEDERVDPEGLERSIDLFAVKEPQEPRPDRSERDVDRIRRRKGVIMMALPVPKEATELPPLRNSPTPVWTPTRSREPVDAQARTTLPGSAPTENTPTETTPTETTPTETAQTGTAPTETAPTTGLQRVSSPVQESPIEGLIAAILLHSEGASGSSTTH